MRRALRSIVRVIVGVIAVLVIALVGARVAITQPGIGRVGGPEGARTDPETLRRHVAYLTREVHPRNHAHPENLDRAAAYIRARFEEAGAEVVDQPYDIRGTRYRNVIARFGPRFGPTIVVGAHYDAFGELPGADDNASGTAGLLELARVLGTRDVSTQVELVAYSTEEPPYFGSADMGSAVHAASLERADADVTAMIGLEMIGYFAEVQPAPLWLLRLFYPDEGNFILIAGRWQDRPLISTVKRSFRGASDLPVTSYCGPPEIGTDLSDHRNYWARGISAVMVTDTAFIRNPNYHEPSDTADTLDYARMADVVDGVANAVRTLAASPGTR